MASTYDIIQYSGQGISTVTGQALVTNGHARWSGSDTPPQPKVSNDKGYDIIAPMHSAASREASFARANGTLAFRNASNGIDWRPLFVTNVGIDLALAGSTAQGRTTRDFYPRNFTQPSFVVEGQALDQLDYGVLTDFVHYMQYASVTQSSPSPMQLYIRGGGLNGSRTRGPGVTKKDKSGSEFHPNQAMRGSHGDLLCQGYIKAMKRQHTQGVYAPTYGFDFIVSAMIKGQFSEDVVQVLQQQNWVSVLKATKTFQVNQALLKENANVLKYAQNNSANVISGG